MNKEKFKENLRKLGNETIDDLEPVVKKSCSNILDFIKETFSDYVTHLFEMRKKKRGENEKTK